MVFRFGVAADKLERERLAHDGPVVGYLQGRRPIDDGDVDLDAGDYRSIRPDRLAPKSTVYWPACP